MRVACLGGGPAGIYFAISMKLRNPTHDIHVFERNRSGDTFGWGVVFSDQTLENLTANDPVSAKVIASSFAHWDDIEVRVNGDPMISTGHGFIGIGRKRLLQILQDRARELGVVMHFETEFESDIAAYADYDLIVAADGINSKIRTDHAERFQPEIQVRKNKFIWLGTPKLFDAFGFFFEKVEGSWIWAHAYRFDAETSTFIVECAPDSWEKIGFDKMSPEESIAKCEQIFARHLDGQPLLTNAAHLRGSAAWINFRRILCHNWSFDNVVLLGDAAHTAHFSIGSGTKLALEDAIKLAEVMDRPGLEDRARLAEALADYQKVRHTEVLKIQNSARNSTEWFETLDRYLDFDLPQFTYSLLTRSQRVSHENLRLRDKPWLEGIERWFWERAGGDPAVFSQPIFAPFSLRGMALRNRLVVSPILTYQADADGFASDFHLAHYGARALGGAGLVMTETLAVAPEGRMTGACPGLWMDKQVEQWARINALFHEQTTSKSCAQIGHAGPRGFAAPLFAASARPWEAGGIVPEALDAAGMARIKAAFLAATARADKAGFDMIEVHAGHGGLLASFISPITNLRDDEHGGSLDNRLRFPLDVIAAVRAAWPDHKPMSVRISANDWMGTAGIQPGDAVEIAKRLRALGIDIVDVSTGETDPRARPVYGRMFQTPAADQIRNEAKIPTITVGNISDADQANGILIAGRADLVALGRPFLANPALVLLAGVRAGLDSSLAPECYRLGFEQLARLERQNQQIVQA